MTFGGRLPVCSRAQRAVHHSGIACKLMDTHTEISIHALPMRIAQGVALAALPATLGSKACPLTPR